MKIPTLIFVVFAAGAVFLFTRNTPKQNSESQATPTPQPLVSLVPPCIPTFLDGGGPYYKPDAPIRSNIAPSKHNGETLSVSGRVLQKDCITPLSAIIVDIWQANESGNYEDEWYRGRIVTDENGKYAFETVVPKGYGEGTGYRPPHIHFKIWQGKTELITSQMFLPASRTQGIEDAYIMNVVTSTQNGSTSHVATHNIILP